MKQTSSHNMFPSDPKFNLLYVKFPLTMIKNSVYIASSKLLEFLKMFIENKSKENLKFQ